jgi:DNA-nicking Smr family endonuclease
MRLAKQGPSNTARSADQPVSPFQEARLFAQAMAEVQPLKSNRHWHRPRQTPERPRRCGDDEHDVLEALQRLVRTGNGYRVSDTSEYMEAASPGVGKEIVRRLHQGRFAIQAHIDLHGLRSEEATDALQIFFRDAIAKGLRAVMVIHGRGLSSPESPVLKQLVYRWLTRGPLRKWIIALASARLCDGGAGATYVLLRQRPASRRERKKK